MGYSFRLLIGILVITAITVPSYLALHYRKIAGALKPTLSYAQFTNAIVRSDAGLPLKGHLDPLQASLAVRDYVYRSYRLERQTLEDATGEILYTSLTSPDGSMYCGGASLAYAWALRAIGIPSRVIQLGGDDFVDGIDYYDTHVTVEVFIDGAWRLSDPTYNVSVSCSSAPNNPVATPEAHACVKRGDSLVLTPGRTQIYDRPEKHLPKIAKTYAFGRYFSAYTRQSVSLPTLSEPAVSFPNPEWIETGLKLNAECGVQLGLPLECGLTSKPNG